MKRFSFPSLSLVLLVISSSVWAHSGGHPIRYVAENGLDAGTCGDPANPCKTIRYAVNQSMKGDKVHVAAGTYYVQGDGVFFLLSDMIKIQGGYSQKDFFQTHNVEDNITTVVGLPAEYRARLSERGFRLLQDTKHMDISIDPEQKNLLSVYSAITTRSAGPIACVEGKAGEFPCEKMDLVSHMPLSQFSSNPSSANDIWGFVDLNDDREYAIIGLQNGTAVVDVTDPTKPKEVGTIPGKSSTWRDVKVFQTFDKEANRWKAYAYVTTEAYQGLQVIDLTQLPATITLAGTYEEFKTAHNIYMANIDYATGQALEGFEPFAYILGSNKDSGAFRVLDLSTPAVPTLVTSPPVSTEYVHDATSMIITDARTQSCLPGHNPCELYIDFNENSVDIWDLTDKAKPHKISSTKYEGSAYTHSGWWSEDKKYIFIHDELDEQYLGANTTLRTMDISNLEQPYISNVWTGQHRAIDHNGFVVGNRYYMSNYRRGLTVLDISDPNQPTEVGYFDTFPAPAENSAHFNGAWGTFPFLKSGYILVSDIEYGLYVIKDNTKG